MQSRVLFCRSNPIAPDPRVEKEAGALVRAGYQVKALGWDRSGLLPVEEELDRVSIIRLPIRAPFGKGIKNFPQLFRWQVHLLTWLVRHRREYEIIHACDFDTILPAFLLKKLAGKKVIYDIFDFYADHLRATPIRIKKMIRALDIWIIGRVDAVILADDARRDQIAGAKPRQLEVIYNSPQELADSLPVFNDAGLKGSFSLVYVGLLQVERGLLQLLQVIERHPNWSLDLAGFGGDEEEIRAAAARLANVIWYGRVPYEKALQLSYSADVLLATYDPRIPNHRYSSPNKVFEAMMLGKPIIVARNTNMDRIIEQADCGLVVEYGDLAGLEAALLKLSQDTELRRRLARNARSAYLKCYSWSQMEDRLLSLYKVVGGSPQGTGL
jgi:glycosyltransferase involved in cell wall biosynthesis